MVRVCTNNKKTSLWRRIINVNKFYIIETHEYIYNEKYIYEVLAENEKSAVFSKERRLVNREQEKPAIKKVNAEILTEPEFLKTFESFELELPSIEDEMSKRQISLLDLFVEEGEDD